MTFLDFLDHLAIISSNTSVFWDWYNKDTEAKYNNLHIMYRNILTDEMKLNQAEEIVLAFIACAREATGQISATIQ
jgi:hypothetical protein